jgi:ABC-type polysaccharide/polyol phosphate transport system ATPase subunit
VTVLPTIAQALESKRPLEVAICLDGVSKAYKLYDRPFNFFKEAFTGRSYHREKVVLSDISLTLKRGEILGIIGRNGAGKSTLLKIIAGTLLPTQGAVNVNGRVAAILELGTGFNPNYSGRDNVILSALMRGMSEDAVRRKFDSIVAFAGLEDVIDEPFHTYSSGMQARLAFAAATAVEADVLVIDEALAAGDIRFASRSLRRIHDICQSGVTALFVSHVTYHVMQLCSRVIWIDDGRIRMDGAPVEVVRAYEYAMHEEIARDDDRLVSFKAANAKSRVKVSPGTLTTTETPAPTNPSAVTRVLASPNVSVSTLKTAAQTESRPSIDVLGVPEFVTPTEFSESVVGARGAANVNDATTSLEDVKAASPELQPAALAEPTHAGEFTQAAGVKAGAPSNDDAAVDVAPNQTGGGVEEFAAPESTAAAKTFLSGQYRIHEIVFLDKNGYCTNTFRFGEPMRMKVSYECLTPELPEYSCGLAVAFNRTSDFEAVMYYNTNYPYADEGLNDNFGAPFRKHLGRAGELEAAIDPLQLRAGEYFVSLGILPNPPGPQHFNEYMHCHCRIKIVANGFDEPAIFYPVVRWNNGPAEK